MEEGEDQGGWTMVQWRKAQHKPPVSAYPIRFASIATSQSHKQGQRHRFGQPQGEAKAWRFASGSTTAWKDLCNFGRKLEDSCKLSFVSPIIRSDGTKIAKISALEINENVSKWQNTLVGYVIGDKPFYSHLKACVGRLWKPTCSLDVHSRDNGFFFFRFRNRDESERVLQGGPWLFDGRLIILKRWDSNAGLDRDLLTSLPLWIRFPSLDLKLWSPSILSKIASVVGHPLYCDNATAHGDRYSYARAFVEVSASSDLPNSVMVELEDNTTMEVALKYKWTPP